jgi:hypothetical protein
MPFLSFPINIYRQSFFAKDNYVCVIFNVTILLRFVNTTVMLDIIHRLSVFDYTTFSKLDRLPSSGVKKMGSYSDGPVNDTFDH